MALPVFSQSSQGQRLTALSESMGATINRSSSKLADFNSQIKDDGDIKVYTSYKRRFEGLSNDLNESEGILNLYLRTNERSNIITDERDNYEKILGLLQTLKSDFDNYTRTAR
jgi:hypothetical protein